MSRKIVHPWWIHVPVALLVLAYVVVSLSTSGTWPDRVPLQIGFNGQPTAWGSPWIAFALVTGLSLLFLAIAALIDELWARQCTVVALLGAIWLETLRPFSPPPNVIVEPKADAFARSLDERIVRGERVVYWDVQNPAYVTWLSLGLPLLFWVSGGLIYALEPWASVLLASLGLLFVQFYGGQRTRVTNDTVTIRYGLAGIRVFRCTTASIVGVSIRSFAALQEFGGYGIRLSGSTMGYFLAGSRGVRIERSGRRDVLIGSRQPERLAEAVRAVSSLAEIQREERKTGS